jgi:membrane protein
LAEDSTQTTAENGHVRAERFRIFAHALWRFRGVDVNGLAAETAYFSILAIAPFLLFLLTGLAIISQFAPVAMVDDLEQSLLRMAPGDTGELMEPMIEEALDRTDSGALSFGMLSAIVVAMWSGGRAIGSLMKGIARISSTTIERPALWNRIVSIALAVVMGAVSILSVAVFLFGRGLGREVAGWVRLGDTFSSIWTYLSWPLMVGIVLLMISLFYWLAAGRNATQQPFFSPGAVVAMVLWILVMLGVRVFLWVVNPGSIYGALGSFVVLVVFFYIMSLVLLFGAAINAEVRERSESSA